jgi:hypothetical protein
MTNVPSIVFGPRGYVAPTEASVLAGAFADIISAFGGNLNPSLSTPQGQIAMSEAAIIGNVNNTFVFMSNQFNPAFAVGRWQDGLANIYFITRNPALPTVVQATCGGAVGVVIPKGSLAQTADGVVYVSDDDGTIGAGGTVVIEFSCSSPGPLPCPAGQLNTIYQVIPGWDTVTNLSDGVIGQDIESAQDFEFRRFQSVAGNSTGALPAIRGAVLTLDGVLDAYVVENTSSSPATIGGVTLDAKSLYVAVVGGDSDEIAHAIWTKKAPGCSYNGNTSVTVYDTSYDVPQPSYVVKFERPAPMPIIFAVNIVNNALVPANAVQLIQDAIIGAFSGSDGGARARIGSTVYASRYYAAVAALGPWVQIISILVGCQNSAAAKCTAGSISGTTFTSGGTVTGAFAIGQSLVDESGVILPGTVITGGSGTSWTINQTQTVASTAVYGVLASANDVVDNIDQVPTISALNIQVTAS